MLHFWFICLCTRSSNKGYKTENWKRARTSPDPGVTRVPVGAAGPARLLAAPPRGRQADHHAHSVVSLVRRRLLVVQQSHLLRLLKVLQRGGETFGRSDTVSVNLAGRPIPYVASWFCYNSENRQKILTGMGSNWVKVMEVTEVPAISVTLT